MSRGHGRGAGGIEHVAAGDSVVHRVDARVKVVGLVALVVVSVSTPPGAWAAYAIYLSLLVAVAGAARLRPGYLATRLTVETPFLVAAGLLVIVTPGRDGLVAAGTLALRVTIGTLAMLILASSTPFPILLRAFTALRAPRIIIMIVAFMWRYLYVLAEEFRRLRLARQARGESARWLSQTGAHAASIATLFVRSLERGERVFVAMTSRGYAGGVPMAASAPLTLRPADAAIAGGFALLVTAARLAA